MRRARIKVAPALPARRTATTKATDPKIAIEDLNEEANQQNDEKIFQVGKSSEASNEVQASNNETQEKIETALPTKVFKTSFNTQECEQDKQDDIQEHFKTPDSNNKIVDEASETITSDVTLTIAGAPQKARSRVKIMPHLKVARNTSVLKSTTSVSYLTHFPKVMLIYKYFRNQKLYLHQLSKNQSKKFVQKLPFSLHYLEWRVLHLATHLSLHSHLLQATPSYCHILILIPEFVLSHYAQ